MVDSTTQSNGNSTEQQQDEDEVLDLFSENADEKIVPAPEGDKGDSTGATDQQGGEGGVELPEKYRGKSIQEVIDMHQNLEKVYGRHNNELGELRKLTDEILQQQLKGTASSEAGAAESVDRDDLLDNPTATINDVVEKSETVRNLEARLDAKERADQLIVFNAKYPDADKVFADPRFADWLKESPTRVRLFQQADKTYDYDLAGELLNTFSELNAVNQEAGDAERTVTKNSLRTPKANAGSSTGSKKIVFKRADLMKLKATDPDRYERLQPQILAAYAEGRVR